MNTPGAPTFLKKHGTKIALIFFVIPVVVVSILLVLKIGQHPSPPWRRPQENNTESGGSCEPLPDDEDDNAIAYRLNTSNVCVPAMCEQGYSFNDDGTACEMTSLDSLPKDPRAQIIGAVTTEVNKTDRVFVSMDDGDNDMSEDVVVAGFVNHDCSGGRIAECAAEFVDYCDNNPASSSDPLLKLDCDHIVTNLGIGCAADEDCGGDKKCQSTADGSKKYCV